MKELIKLLNKKSAIFSFIFSIIFYICEVGTSFVLAYYTTLPITEDKIITLAIILAGIYALMHITHWFAIYINDNMLAETEIKIKNYFYKKIQKVKSTDINQLHTGYIYNLINDISKLFVSLLDDIENILLPLIIGIISFIIMACSHSIIMGLTCVLICIIAIYTKYKMVKNRQYYEQESRKRHSKYVAILIDFIQNIMTVKKLNIKNFSEDKIEEAAKQYKHIMRKNIIKKANHNTVFHFIMRSIYVIVILSTIIIIRQEKDALSYLIFYLTLLTNIYKNVNNMVKLLDTKTQFDAVKIKLDSCLNDLEELVLVSNVENIKLRNVKFSYKDSNEEIIIPKISLNKGDKISIIGESGQGKTTILNLLAGIYDIKEGDFIVNNKITTNIKPKVVFVSQEIELFNLSIKDNLCLGKDIEIEYLEELFKEAKLFDWYKNLPFGLDTIVGEKGVKLSAGQKQRLNLIRGILKDEEIYFFDEPTSNLDGETEEKIINMMKKYLKNKTYIIVTHKLKLKSLCNKYYEMDNHEIKQKEYR